MDEFHFDFHSDLSSFLFELNKKYKKITIIKKRGIYLI